MVAERVMLVNGIDYRARAHIGLAVAAVLLLTPFSINNFLQGRFMLGVGTSVIVIAIASSAWMTSHRRDPTLISLFLLVPSIIAFVSMSLHGQGVIGVLWSYPSMLAFFILLKERVAIIAGIALIVVITPQAWSELGPGIGLRTAATLTAAGVFTAIFVYAITEAQEKLQTLAITDPLTGLRNRVMLDDAMLRAIQQFKRSKTQTSLLAIDIDHFKPVNDDFGHAVGDEILVKVSEVLATRFRQVDQIFRFGGEEFLVLLNETGLNEAAKAADDLRQLIEEKKLLSGRALTVSIGVAELTAEDDSDTWMQRADANLYKAKETGRNRVVA